MTTSSTSSRSARTSAKARSSRAWFFSGEARPTATNRVTPARAGTARRARRLRDLSGEVGHPVLLREDVRA